MKLRFSQGPRMTESQRDLLQYLSTRTGVVPIHKKHLDDLRALHEAGLVATHGAFARITIDGERALAPGEGVRDER